MLFWTRHVQLPMVLLSAKATGLAGSPPEFSYRIAGSDVEASYCYDQDHCGYQNVFCGLPAAYIRVPRWLSQAVA
jgi:hypothetical protein